MKIFFAHFEWLGELSNNYFCMGINDQRVGLMTSVNIFLNANDFNSLSMKDRWLFILTDAGYNEITEWEPFGGIVHEMMMIKHEAICKL